MGAWYQALNQGFLTFLRSRTIWAPRIVTRTTSSRTTNLIES